MLNSGMMMMLKNMLGISEEDLKKISEEVIPQFISTAQEMAARSLRMEQQMQAICENQIVIIKALNAAGIIRPADPQAVALVEGNKNGHGSGLN